MAISTQIQNLNLIPGKSAPVVVHLSQGNIGNTVQFYLYDGDNPYYPTNVSIAVHGVRADNTVFGPYAARATSGSNLVSFDIVTAMTSVAGAAIGELVLTDSNQNQIGSANFGMLVEETPYSSSVTYEDDLSIYQRILSYVKSIPASIESELEQTKTDLQQTINSEIATRHNQNVTLTESLSTEVSQRKAADSSLQSQINQIVSPSGSAPSAAEVQNIRVALDGTVYDLAGDAVRQQFADITEISKNLFFGKFVNGQIDGNGAEYTTPNTYIHCVSFIPVDASTLYRVSVYTNTAFLQLILLEYNASKQLVSRRVVGSTSSAVNEMSRSITTGSSTVYIKILIYSSSNMSISGNKAQVEIGNEPTSYAPHISAVDYALRENLSKPGAINGIALEDETVAITKTKDIFEYNYQYVFLDDVKTGRYYTAAETTAESSSASVVPYKIKVNANTTYTYRGLYNRWCIYVDSHGISTFFSNTDSYADGTLTPATDGYVYLTIPYSATEGVKKTAMFCKGQLPQGRVEGSYNVSLLNSNEVKENTISVSLDGSKDFTSIKAAIDSITDANKRNTYTIKIYPGTYNIRSYFTSEQWSTESTAFVGLTVPDYVTLEGVGNKEAVILTASDTTKRNYISTLNLANTSGLRNMTVKADHLRYVIHDDYATDNLDYYERICEDVIFDGVNLYYYDTYGSAIKANGDFHFINCLFINRDADGYGFSMHNHEGMINGARVEFDNCRFTAEKGLRFRSMTKNANGIINHVVLKGTKASLLRLEQENGAVYGTGCLWSASGYANNITRTEVSSTDGVDYSDRIDLI